MEKCSNCDQICITPFNPDQECWGRMTAEERAAFYGFLTDSGLPINRALPQPQQPYGQPQELPTQRIPEAQKHHVTRSGR
jgi:hypothetical protein